MSAAVMDCEFCGEEVKAAAKKCRHCGEFFDKPGSGPESDLISAQPSALRNYPGLFIFGVLFTLCWGMGIPILLVLWLKCKMIKITVTSKRTMLREGILSKHTSEVMHDHVRNIKESASFMERILGVGSISISSAGTSGDEITISGLKKEDLKRIKATIEKHRV